MDSGRLEGQYSKSDAGGDWNTQKYSVLPSQNQDVAILPAAFLAIFGVDEPSKMGVHLTKFGKFQ